MSADNVRIERDPPSGVLVPADKTVKMAERLTRWNFLAVGTTSLAGKTESPWIGAGRHHHSVECTIACRCLQLTITRTSSAIAEF